MSRRVLFIAERFPPDLGGLAVSSARTARSLAEAGAEVDVLAWTRATPPGKLETHEDGSVAVHRLGLFHNWDLSLQHTVNVVEWLHQRHGYALVWGHYLYPPGFMAVLLAGLLGVPSVVSARGNDVDRMMFPPGDFGRLTWTLERASRVTAVSRDLAKKIGVLLGRDADVTVTPNVVDSDTFAPGAAEPGLREELGIAPDEVVLGFSGELRHKKGLPFILRALTEVRARRPAVLLVIGEVRPREQEHIASFGADHPEDRQRIVVTGHLEAPRDVARHLRLCDVLLMPSLWDGMPNAVLEAMSTGTLVLGSDAGGIPEAISHGETGFVVPRAELSRLGEGILELLAAPHGELQAVRDAARARILASFRPEHEVAALSNLLDELTNGERSASASTPR